MSIRGQGFLKGGFEYIIINGERFPADALVDAVKLVREIKSLPNTIRHDKALAKLAMPIANELSGRATRILSRSVKSRVR